jgi:acyl-coenzyme A thioesterase PaaI-like protein
MVPEKGPLAVTGDEPPAPGVRSDWILLPKHGPCFVCQPDNPGGLRADLYRDGEVVRCPFRFRIAQMGPPGHAHGGSLAALMDEVLGAAAWLHRPNVLAAHLELDFRRPTPLDTDLMAVGWVQATGNRSVRVLGRLLLPDGRASVEASGVFAVARDMFTRPFFG